MRSLSIAVKMGFLSAAFCMVLSTPALSTERAVFDKPDVEQPGTTIYAKVVKVVERDRATHKWDVSVENKATGEVVLLHLDKTTERKEKDPDPAPGDIVVVKYDQHSKHALTFVKDDKTIP